MCRVRASPLERHKRKKGAMGGKKERARKRKKVQGAGTMRQVEDGCVRAVRPVPSMALLCPAKVRSTPLGHFRTLRTSRPEEVSPGLPLAFSSCTPLSPYFSRRPAFPVVSIFLFHILRLAVQVLNKYLNAAGYSDSPPSLSLSLSLSRLPIFARDPVLLSLATFCLRSRPYSRVSRGNDTTEKEHAPRRNEFP